jgi:hypothetical protein
MIYIYGYLLFFLVGCLSVRTSEKTRYFLNITFKNKYLGVAVMTLFWPVDIYIMISNYYFERLK